MEIKFILVLIGVDFTPNDEITHHESKWNKGKIAIVNQYSL